MYNVLWGLGIGDWGLGIGDWAQSPIPNPQSPIVHSALNCLINNLYIYITFLILSTLLTALMGFYEHQNSKPFSKDSGQ